MIAPKSKKPSLNLQTLINNRRYLLYTIGLGLISAAMVIMVVIPQVKQVFFLRRKIETVQKQAEVLQQKSVQLSNLDVEVDFARRDLVDQVLPSKKPLLELLASLNQIADQSQVVFTDFQLSPGEISTDSASSTPTRTSSRRSNRQTGTNYDSIDVRLTINGSFNQVQQFISVVERVAPLTSIKNLSLNTVFDSAVIKAEDNVEAELTLTVFYFTGNVSAAVTSALPNVSTNGHDILNEISTYVLLGVNEQQQIKGGGLLDLFGLSQEELEAVESF